MGIVNLACLVIGNDSPQLYQYLGTEAEGAISYDTWSGGKWIRGGYVNVKGTPITARGGRLFCLVAGGSDPRVYYLNSDLWEAAAGGSNGWTLTDLNGGRVAAPDVHSPLTGVVVGGGDPRVYYVTGSADDIIEAAWNNGGWQVSQVGQNLTWPARSLLSSYASTVVAGENPRVYFQDQSQMVWELAWNDGWLLTNISSKSGAPPSLFGAGVLTATVVNDGNDPRVYCLDGQRNVWEIGWYNGWKASNITVAGGGAPATAASPLACIEVTTPLGDLARVYYLDGNQSVHQLAWNGKAWHDTNLTLHLEATPAVAGSPLVATAVNTTDPRVYFVGSDGLCHEFAFDKLKWHSTTLP